MARILIIDDDENMLYAMSSALRRQDHEVVEAANGERGLRAYRAEPTDLVITDIVMPDMDGTQVLLELKKEAVMPKVIVISGAGRASSYLTVAENLGADVILQKPITVEGLLAAVRRVLSDA